MKSTTEGFCKNVGIIMFCVCLSGCAWVNAAGRTYEGAGEGLKKASDETEPGFSKTVFSVSGKISSAVGQILVDASGEDISPSDTAETTETTETTETKQQLERKFNSQFRFIRVRVDRDGFESHRHNLQS